MPGGGTLGATKFYGAALYRLRERNFGELKHHDGISPAWPIGYDVLESYYTQAEELDQVHGARVKIQPIRRRRDRTRSRPCLMSLESRGCSMTWLESDCTPSTLPAGSCSRPRHPPELLCPLRKESCLGIARRITGAFELLSRSMR
ncbi:MAG: hypothetical protein ACRDPL_07820, partial [Propionibacteriaceae bacterium]